MYAAENAIHSNLLNTPPLSVRPDAASIAAQVPESSSDSLFPEPSAAQSKELKEEWKQELLSSYTSVNDLVRANLLLPFEAIKLQSLGDQFKVRITPYYASLMTKDTDCPIRKQAIPHLDEEDPVLPDWASELSKKIYDRPTPWHADAIGDMKNLAAPRLTHRYLNRAIIHLSSSCAVYCRFCFRKSHLNATEKSLYEGSLDPAFDYLKNHTEIREVILTGGDPLAVTDSVLHRVFERIENISHIRTVRIHSRMAVTLPSRFTSSLLEVFERHSQRLNISVVSHFNHSQEISPRAVKALRDLKRTGVSVLNQSVFLNGVNQSFEVLRDLFLNLYETGVIPFYLHHPDWTPGTFHFRESIEEGRSVYSKLRGILPGPALPHYILDIPQGYGKVSLVDFSLNKVKTFRAQSAKDSSSSIEGALYEITSPTTKNHQNSSHLYLDLFRST